MASIEYRTRSTRVIAYVNKEGQSFVLGRVTKKTADRLPITSTHCCMSDAAICP